MLRRFFISLLHACVSVAVILSLSLLILPKVTGLTLGIPIWIMQFVVAFLFGSWAFSKSVPDLKAALIFLWIWLPVNLGVDGLYLSVAGVWSKDFVLPIDLIIQTLLEIFAILLASYKIRRAKLKEKFAD